MFYIKFRKRDKDYMYLYQDKLFIEKFLTFHSLYKYIRDNNINFEHLKIVGLNFELLFYHFVFLEDMEQWYIRNANLTNKKNVVSLLEKNRL